MSKIVFYYLIVVFIAIFFYSCQKNGIVKDQLNSNQNQDSLDLLIAINKGLSMSNSIVNNLLSIKDSNLNVLDKNKLSCNLITEGLEQTVVELGVYVNSNDSLKTDFFCTPFPIAQSRVKFEKNLGYCYKKLDVTDEKGNHIELPIMVSYDKIKPYNINNIKYYYKLRFEIIDIENISGIRFYYSFLIPLNLGLFIENERKKVENNRTYKSEFY